MPTRPTFASLERLRALLWFTGPNGCIRTAPVYRYGGYGVRRYGYVRRGYGYRRGYRRW